MTDLYATEEETQALIKPNSRTPAEKKLDTMLAQRDTFEQGYENDAVLIRAIAIELIEAADAERVKVQRQVKEACKPYGKAGECVYTTFMAKQKGKA
jgi:hypothetical protein